MSTYAAILVLLVSEVLKLNVIVIAERKIKEIDKSKKNTVSYWNQKIEREVKKDKKER